MHPSHILHLMIFKNDAHQHQYLQNDKLILEKKCAGLLRISQTFLLVIENLNSIRTYLPTLLRAIPIDGGREARQSVNEKCQSLSRTACQGHVLLALL